MKDSFVPKLVAIAGGSGSGKSWLTERLHAGFREQSACVSLDNFYRDRSETPAGLRSLVNYDHPRAIDWEAAETFFSRCREGGSGWLPDYDFKTHTRAGGKVWPARPLILVDGLWLLWRPTMRRLFDLTIYVDCPERVRLSRRIARDIARRGRTAASVREQFQKWVGPMHAQFVEPQKKWADIILAQPLGKREVEWVSEHIWNMLATRTSRAPWAEPVHRLDLKAKLMETPL
ncbi:MAG TPA: uridine kinase [Candidatus Saccharimonadales bacterium]|nr:uridine kinase [Candidatus Saccharimonadales bacterium]